MSSSSNQNPLSSDSTVTPNATLPRPIPPPSRRSYKIDVYPRAGQNVPAGLETELFTVTKCQQGTLDHYPTSILNPKKVLEAKTLKYYLPDTHSSYVISSNMRAGYWREIREAPDPENHEHDDPAPHRDGLKSLCLRVKDHGQQTWKELYLLPRHSISRRRALALNLKPKDNRADFVDYFFDKNLACHLVPSAKLPAECGDIRIHEAVSGVAVFKDDISVSVVGLRVGSMTALGWVYCGYRDYGNHFIPCDLIVSEKPETMESMARLYAAARVGNLTDREAEEAVFSSDEDSEGGVVMRNKAYQDELVVP